MTLRQLLLIALLTVAGGRAWAEETFSDHYDRAVAFAQNDQHSEALKELQKNWFKDTPLDTLRISYDALLPAMSKTGAFSQQGLEKFVHVYRTVGERTNVDLREGKFWTNAYTKD